VNPERGYSPTAFDSKKGKSKASVVGPTMGFTCGRVDGENQENLERNMWCLRVA